MSSDIHVELLTSALDVIKYDCSVEAGDHRVLLQTALAAVKADPSVGIDTALAAAVRIMNKAAGWYESQIVGGGVGRVHVTRDRLWLTGQQAEETA